MCSKPISLLLLLMLVVAAVGAVLVAARPSRSKYHHSNSDRLSKRQLNVRINRLGLIRSINAADLGWTAAPSKRFEGLKLKHAKMLCGGNSQIIAFGGWLAPTYRVRSCVAVLCGQFVPVGRNCQSNTLI